MKVLLILVDGMRSDAIGDLPQVKRMMEVSAYTLNAQTVMPSVTLPCHMSLFHSVDPERHGITTNTYVPQVRPIRGLCEVLASAGKKNAMFYAWEEVRDLARPGSIAYANFLRGKVFGYDKVNNALTDSAMQLLNSDADIDFSFLYLGYVDAAGHKDGWMSEGYMDAIRNSWENIERITAALPEDYAVIVTADHGGHDRTHGYDVPTDMTIPLFLKVPDVAVGELDKAVSIKDIAPTIVNLFGLAPDEDWEGKNLL